MAYSQGLRDDILSWLRGTVMPTVPANLYAALLTTNPSDETGTALAEVVNGSAANQWNGYARQAIPSTTSGWTAPAGTNPRHISNANTLDYGNAVISSGSVIIVGVAFYDAATAGNFKGWTALGASITITNGIDVQLPAGSVVWNQ